MAPNQDEFSLQMCNSSNYFNQNNQVSLAQIQKWMLIIEQKNKIKKTDPGCNQIT